MEACVFNGGVHVFISCGNIYVGLSKVLLVIIHVYLLFHNLIKEFLHV